MVKLLIFEGIIYIKREFKNKIKIIFLKGKIK
jgi:hypothetical protein